MSHARFLLSALASTIVLLSASCALPRASVPVVGAKNFTEQVLLGELLAQQIEQRTHLRVERRFYLAGSYIAHQALISGRIDVYPEYTGTALSSILKQPIDKDASRVRQTIARLYQSRYQVTVGPAFGFQNTFAMIVRGSDAKKLNLRTLSHAAAVAPQMRLGVGYEFEERPDGLPGLESAYHLSFAGSPRVMDLGLLYRSLNADQVDIIAGNSTDGPIQSFGLTVLDDDRHFFPPYEAVPLVREDALKRWPAMRVALEDLAGVVDAFAMQSMNRQVDSEHRDPADVVREFRQAHKLIR